MKSICFGCKKTHESYQWKTYYDGNSLITICSLWYKPSGAPEIVPQRIKNEREQFFKSTVQPWRQGEPSKEFMELYPQRASKLFTPKEQIKAKYTWKGEPGWNHRQKTK